MIFKFIKTKANNPLILATTTLLFSLILSFYMIGWNHINIFNTSWITGDMAQVFMAWSQFFSEQHLFFDLKTNRLSYPLDISIALFDTMPILVELSKPFTDLFPDNTQFIGIYLSLCLVLQGYFGFLTIWYLVDNIKVINMKNRFLISLFGAIFFIVAPYTLTRMQGHIALSSQWLLILGILINIKFNIINNYKNTVLQAAYLFIVAGFNPYFAAMGLLTPFVILLHGLINKRINFVYFLSSLLVLLVFIVFSFYIFGFLEASGSGIHVGYGIFSMNFFALIDPNHYNSILFSDIPSSIEGQYFEGFQYQGLGLIIMLIIGFLFIRKNANVINLTISIKVILTIIIISFLLSLSNIVTFADFLVIKIPIPDLLESLLSKYRASGRFFWIGGFWLIIVAFILIIKNFKINHAVMIISVASMIQIIDIFGTAQVVKSHLNSIKTKTISDTFLNKLEEQNLSSIMVIPPWQCDNMQTPGGINNYETLGFLAINNNLTINNFYAARTPEYQSEYHCNKNAIYTFHPQNDNVYVLSKKEFNLRKKIFSRSKFSCKKIISNNSDYYICIYKKTIDNDSTLKENQ